MVVDVVLDVGIITGAADWEDVRDAVDITGSHEHFWFDERDLTHIVEIEIPSEVGDGFHFFKGEVGTKIVAESAG